MTPLGEILAAKIAREGPISFYDFMWWSLYHPELGYYRRPRDPFGKGGDFYTAEQLQPVFGSLVARRVRQLARGMGDPLDFTVVELGAGRGEMADAFAEWFYVPVETEHAALPKQFRGLVFCNEFFDALPVRAVKYERGEFREQLVTFSEGRFHWTGGPPLADHDVHVLRRYYPPPEEGRWYEARPLELWMAKIAGALTEGFLLTIDYGFTREESIRFPAGTLMSYRRHSAMEDVLADPGERDITAHVNFSALMEIGETCGLATESFETLASMLLKAGEEDQFAGVLRIPGNTDAAGEQRLAMQLKMLLFGMGETFRVLLQRKRGGQEEAPRK